jgi:uncharacterized protein YeaO (DUF488 family)
MPVGKGQAMGTIAVKRVYDPAAPADGLRILVDRLWPRGLRKETVALDHWSKEVAPSTELRKWFDHRPERFPEFERRYRDELAENSHVKDLLAQVGHAHATLLYAARDPRINHAVVLAEFLHNAQRR